MAALLLGLAGLTASAAGVVVQLLPRRFSAVQAEQLSTWEMLRRWRTWPAGQIFPRTLGYDVPGYAFSRGPRPAPDRAPGRDRADGALRQRGRCARR